ASGRAENKGSGRSSKLNHFDTAGLIRKALKRLRIVSLPRAALYLRVSTDRQCTENQRPEIEQLACARKYNVVGVYEETMSAAKQRPEYGKMMKAAKKGAFDVLVIWSIDRFGR